MRNAAQTPITHQDFVDGPIPTGYCKEIQVGPEGETGNNSIAPQYMLCDAWGHTHPMPGCRSVIVVHPGGSTMIAWDDAGRFMVQTSRGSDQDETPNARP